MKKYDYDWVTVEKDYKESFWCGVCETIDTREKLIDYILKGEWNNGDWEKDFTIRVIIGDEDNGYALDGRLCLNRDENDFWIAIQIDKYSEKEDWHWGVFDTEDTDNFCIGGKLKDIEEEITKEIYDNIAKEMIKAVKNEYYRMQDKRY